MTREEAIARIGIHKIVHKMDEPRAINISEALDMAIQALEQTRWIPCSEPPKESGKYLVTFGGTHLIGEDFYRTEEDARRDFEEPNEDWRFLNIFMGWRSHNVVAWRPLPEPYKAESEEKEDK